MAITISSLIFFPPKICNIRPCCCGFPYQKYQSVPWLIPGAMDGERCAALTQSAIVWTPPFWLFVTALGRNCYPSMTTLLNFAKAQVFFICFYIWHCVPNILLWSILCKTVGLPSSTGESERTARRQFHSPTLRCFRGRLCEVAAGRGPLKQSRWPESNWTLPLRSVGVAPSWGRFWLVFTALKLRYVLRRHIILSDSDGNQGVLDCFTVYPGLGGSAK